MTAAEALEARRVRAIGAAIQAEIEMNRHPSPEAERLWGLRMAEVGDADAAKCDADAE